MIKRKIINITAVGMLLCVICSALWFVFNSIANLLYVYLGDPCGSGNYCTQYAPVYVNFTNTCDGCVPASTVIHIFSGINGIILPTFPLTSLLTILFVFGAKSYSYARGTITLASGIRTILCISGIMVLVMVMIGPVAQMLIRVTQEIIDGQYQTINIWGQIVQFLYSLTPLGYISFLSFIVAIYGITAEFDYKNPIDMLKSERDTFRPDKRT